jgi:hypothetical protein
VGLEALEKKFKKRKNELKARLTSGKPISEEDERWLDTEANFVDERRILDELDKASDYERGLARLPENDSVILRRLQEVTNGRDEDGKPSNGKRKRESLSKFAHLTR